MDWFICTIFWNQILANVSQIFIAINIIGFNFFILGGIYFVYFYSGPLKNKLVLNENISKLNNKKEKEYFQDQEVLEKVTLDKKSANENGKQRFKSK